jgi:hypothetical protein
MQSTLLLENSDQYMGKNSVNVLNQFNYVKVYIIYYVRNGTRYCPVRNISFQRANRNAHRNEIDKCDGHCSHYQAITTVKLGDGHSCSFWRYVWFADVYPALFNHYTNQEATVNEVLQHGLQSDLVTRLSTEARSQLCWNVIWQVGLSTMPIYMYPDSS